MIVKGLTCHVELANEKDFTSILFTRKLRDGKIYVQKNITLTRDETKLLINAIVDDAIERGRQ